MLQSPQQLSHQLRRTARALAVTEFTIKVDRGRKQQHDHLMKLNKQSLQRLDALIALDARKRREYELMKLVATRAHAVAMQSIEKNQGLYMLAVEYDIDDGAWRQGQGDVLFITGDKSKLYVVECKCVDGYHENLKQERVEKVCSQAAYYSTRVDSWIRHLAAIDDNMTVLQGMDVVGVAVTENEAWTVQ
jgi:hypothetical protein